MSLSRLWCGGHLFRIPAVHNQRWQAGWCTSWSTEGLTCQVPSTLWQTARSRSIPRLWTHVAGLLPVLPSVCLRWTSMHSHGAVRRCSMPTSSRSIAGALSTRPPSAASSSFTPIGGSPYPALIGRRRGLLPSMHRTQLPNFQLNPCPSLIGSCPSPPARSSCCSSRPLLPPTTACILPLPAARPVLLPFCLLTTATPRKQTFSTADTRSRRLLLCPLSTASLFARAAATAPPSHVSQPSLLLDNPDP